MGMNYAEEMETKDWDSWEEWVGWDHDADGNDSVDSSEDAYV